MTQSMDAALRAFAPALPVAVALSGGADSTALLLACAHRWPGRVLAIHVHHGLQAAADGFEQHCVALCSELSVPLRVKRLDARPAPGQSPEDAARHDPSAWALCGVDPGDTAASLDHGKRAKAEWEKQNAAVQRRKAKRDVARSGKAREAADGEAALREAAKSEEGLNALFLARFAHSRLANRRTWRLFKLKLM